MKHSYCVLFLLFLLCSCASSRRGGEVLIYPENPGDPLILRTRHSFYGLASLTIDNTIGTLDRNGDFALISFGQKGIESVRPIKRGLPVNVSFDLDSIPERNILFIRRGMGLYVIDAVTADYSYLNVGLAGNGRIMAVHAFDTEQKLLSVQYHEGAADMLTIFNYLQGRTVMPNEYCFNGTLMPFFPDTLLGMFTDDGIIEWQYTDLLLEKYWDDALTEQLSEKMFHLDYFARGYHQQQRFMIGFLLKDRTPLVQFGAYATAFWDENRQNIRIETFKVNGSEGFFLSPDSFIVSPCGKYVKAIFSPPHDSGLSPQLAMLFIDEKYPAGISEMVLLGPTRTSNYGAFMNHSEWGPCYVEFKTDVRRTLFVYRLEEHRTL